MFILEGYGEEYYWRVYKTLAKVKPKRAFSKIDSAHIVSEKAVCLRITVKGVRGYMDVIVDSPTQTVVRIDIWGKLKKSHENAVTEWVHGKRFQRKLFKTRAAAQLV